MASFMVPKELAAKWQLYDEWVSTSVFSGLRAIGLSDASKPASRLTKHLPFIDSPTPAVTIIAAYLLIVTVGSAFLRRSQTPRGPDPAWLRHLVQVIAAVQPGDACEVLLLCPAMQPCAQSRRKVHVALSVQVHNVVLIVLSAGMAASSIYWARAHNYSFWGNAYRPSERAMGLTIYVFYVSKFYEFFDTVGAAAGCVQDLHTSTAKDKMYIQASCLSAQIIMLLKGKVQQISLLHVYHHASISFIWCAHQCSLQSQTACIKWSCANP
jgi:elongation of very long chain fatty acids protein 4